MIRLIIIVTIVTIVTPFSNLYSQQDQSQFIKENEFGIRLSSEVISQFKVFFQEDHRVMEYVREKGLDESLIRMLLDKDSDPDECEKAVIRFIRQKYVDSHISKPDSIQYYFDYPLADKCSTYIRMLFYFKGNDSGLYEFIRLSGSKDPIDFRLKFVESEQEEKMLTFELYCMITELNRKNLFMFALDKNDSGFQNMIHEFKRHLFVYGTNKELLNNFLLNYPFMDGSYFKIRELIYVDPRVPNLIPDKNFLFFEYYDEILSKVQVSNAQKIEFLDKIQKVFGRERLKQLTSYILKKAQQDETDLSYYKSVIGLAIDNKLYDVVGAFAEKNQNAVNYGIVDMLHKREMVVSDELLLIQKLTDSLYVEID